MSKTMELLDFGEIFQCAERPITFVYYIFAVQQFYINIFNNSTTQSAVLLRSNHCDTQLTVHNATQLVKTEQ